MARFFLLNQGLFYKFKPLAINTIAQSGRFRAIIKNVS
ncbi:MAG: hypothetical protein RIR11_1369 [Bacteroidota bacterium]